MHRSKASPLQLMEVRWWLVEAGGVGGKAHKLVFHVEGRSSSREAVVGLWWLGQWSLAISISGVPSLPTQQSTTILGQKTSFPLENLFFKVELWVRGHPRVFYFKAVDDDKELGAGFEVWILNMPPKVCDLWTAFGSWALCSSSVNEGLELEPSLFSPYQRFNVLETLPWLWFCLMPPVTEMSALRSSFDSV